MTDSPRDRALNYLTRHSVMGLATQGPEGLWAAAVFYVNDGFTLYFLSSPTSRHGRNLSVDGRVAVTIQEDYRDWPQIKGIQMEGVATPIDGSEQGKAQTLYGMKFPVAGKLAHVPAAIVQALAKACWYKVVPERLHFIDNSIGFGHRDQIL